MNVRNLTLAIVMLITSSVAFASTSDYNINMQVFPANAYENIPVLIAGYITIDDWGKIVPASELNVRIQKSSEVVMKINYDELHYTNDIGKSDKLVDGFFYKKVTLSPGTYYVAVFLGDEQVSNYKLLTVKEGNSNLTLNGLGFTEKEGPSFELNYSGLLSNPSAKVEIYGRKNFDSPASFSYALTNGVVRHVLGIDGFSLSDYAGEDEVYGLIVYAQAGDEAAEPFLVVRNTGVKSSAYGCELSADEASVKKGAVQKIPVKVRNTGSLLTEFTFSFGGSLGDYASAESVDIAPGDEKTVYVQLDVPRDYVPASGILTINASGDGNYLATADINVKLAQPDPVHNVTVEGIHFSKDSYFNDEDVRGLISLRNSGDYTEKVNVRYYFEGGKVYKDEEVLMAGETSDVTFILPAKESASLHVEVSNDYLTYASKFNVNVVPKSYDFSFYATETSAIVQDKPTYKDSLVIKNKGNVEDLFVIRPVDYDNCDFNKSGSNSLALTLKPGESATVNVTISIPKNKDALNVTFSACSQIGNKCREDKVNVNIFNIPHSEKKARPSIVNISRQEEDGEDVFVFDITNNNLVSKSYKLNYSTDADVNVTIYPESFKEGYVIQPGEQASVYLYASSADSCNITYSITEGDELLANGTLTIESRGPQGLTGFAVAAGSVLGVAGLVILVLFIYFYFIRKPPEGGDDEFKPVEVKKADLSKPNVKNESQKYW